jgi:enoyl-CoA hydratase/carnithine racemase
MAGTALMRTLARDDVIRELTYTGRIFSAQEALAYGFATRISEDPHTEALALAREIATKSPDAIQGTKRLLNIPASIDSATSLLAEAVEQAKLIGSPNQIEAVKSNLEKRAALFADPDSAATALWTPRDDTERK